MKRNFVIITSFSFIVLLNGCERPPSTAKICKNNPEICTDLHSDGWCDSPRADLVSDRLAIKESAQPSGELLYQLLVHTEKYNYCIWLGSGVKHVAHPERSADKARAYGMNSETLRTLQEQTKTSDDPMLAYYRWTRFGDEKALQRVLQAENQGEIRNPEVLGALGGHYLRVDPDKAKRLYLLAMKLANKDSFNSDWLLGLAEVYQAQPEQYYLLSKTTVMLTKQGLNQQRLNATINNPQRIAQLDDAAEALAIAISKGRYAESEWPAKLASGQPVPAP